jgi:hypothetical protein
LLQHCFEISSEEPVRGYLALAATAPAELLAIALPMLTTSE